jgi:hypothetical protein
LVEIKKTQGETKMQTFIYNDGGRADAGYKGTAGDCVCRAIANATKLPYQEVYDVLAEGNATQPKGKLRRRHGKKSTGVRTARHGISVKRQWFKNYMQDLGFEWVSTMKVGSKVRVHLCKEELPKGTLVLQLSKHYTCMIDGVIYDTYNPQRIDWDGRHIRTVYGYWKLKNAQHP